MKPNGPRRPLDAYYTPDDLAQALVGVLPIPVSATVLEPHVGGGAFARALGDRVRWLSVCDIDPDARGLELWDAVHVGDFLDYRPAPHDWIVGNPPFENFEAHVDHALSIAPNVVFLLRTAVMSSKGRIPHWKRWPLRHFWVLAERPSFTEDGKVDRYDYSWFWFQRGHSGPATSTPGWSWRQPTTKSLPRPASDPAPAENKPQPRAVDGCPSGLSSRTARATPRRRLLEASGSPTLFTDLFAESP